MAKERCSERVPDRDTNWPGSHQCNRKGILKRDGKLYCKQHDPVAVKKRSDERSAKWEKEWDDKREGWRRDTAMAKVCNGVSTDELERLGTGGLAELLKEATNG